MEESLIGIKNSAISLIIDSNDLKSLEEVKLQFLGRRGKVTSEIKENQKIQNEKRPEIGMLANEVKNTIEETIFNKEKELSSQKFETRKEKIDKTAPGTVPEIGHLHPMTQMLWEVVDVFKSLGYQAADGPEIETDYYNFEVLNIPKHHPAKDTHQTLYLHTPHTNAPPREIILRTHTSP